MAVMGYGLEVFGLEAGVFGDARGSILGPISTPSWKAKTKSG